MTRSKGSTVGSLALPAGLLPAGDSYRRARDGGQAAKGLRRPADAGIGGRQPDSGRWFDSYPGEDELPSAGRFCELAGCDSLDGGVSCQDFDATLDRLGDLQPWMDGGQIGGRPRLRAPAGSLPQPLRRTRRLPLRARHRREIPIYFLGVDEDGLSGLLTVNIET